MTNDHIEQIHMNFISVKYLKFRLFFLLEYDKKTVVLILSLQTLSDVCNAFCSIFLSVFVANDY